MSKASAEVAIVAASVSVDRVERSISVSRKSSRGRMTGFCGET
jgi:hypothetical protein